MYASFSGVQAAEETKRGHEKDDWDLKLSRDIGRRGDVDVVPLAKSAFRCGGGRWKRPNGRQLLDEDNNFAPFEDARWMWPSNLEKRSE